MKQPSNNQATQQQKKPALTKPALFEPGNSSEIIVAKNVSISYRGKTVWSGANFAIKRGEFIGLLGANGAGKTTLFRVILGLARPTNGEIRLFGAEPQRGNMRVGYVPQRRFIDADSRVEALEYVRLGIRGGQLGFSLPRAARQERTQALEALKQVDVTALARRPLAQLSGGELQRVFLAQALVGKPDVLLLDEPLANLDIRRETQLIRVVSDVARSQNIAVMLIAHDINPLLPVVDRIIYIANGKIASGKPESIVTSETLSALYGAPIEVLRSPKGRLAVLGVEEAEHHAE
jgi:zinc/manganese transport system ATP-binding protein